MSRKKLPAAFLALLLSAVTGFSYAAAGGDFVGGLGVGTSGGLGVQLSGTLVEFTRDVPLSARIAFGYHSSSAGDPFAARQIFINNNTNGTPEDSAEQWQFRFDLLVPLFSVGPQQIILFGGPRHSSYTANFEYVGGNEKFDVTASPWGAGVGVETHFVISEKTSFQLQVGVDFYQEVELAGHDTVYSPDGTDVNPREDYDFSSADEAIDQPEVEILGMMGLLVRF